MGDDDQRREIAVFLRLQAAGPDPFYASLLNAAADDLEAGGPTWRPLSRVADLPPTENLPLRLMGAAHRAALLGDAPDYARHLETCGGDGDAEAAWRPFRDLCGSGALDEGILQPVQTNEVSRTAALLPGFAAVHAATGLPLRLLEIGASAGLLLRFDRYRYAIGEATWGDPGSPVLVAAEGDPPLGDAPVADRRGCDVRPLDPVRDRILLLSFIWPDQVERFRTVDAALSLAAEVPVVVDEASAPDWLAEQLHEPQPGVATVVYQSVMWQYLTREERKAAKATIVAAGERATPDAPVAWLRLEGHRELWRGAELRLWQWPGGEDRSLAMCGYHGGPIRWGPGPP